MKHTFLKTICLLIAYILLFNCSYFVLAANNIATINDEIYVVSEESFLRKEYEKHYIMSDNSMLVTTYDEPIHYYEDNEWKDIDNTLQLENGILTNTKNPLFNVEIDSNTNSNNSITICDNDLSLKWSYRLFNKSEVIRLDSSKAIDYNTLELKKESMTADSIFLPKLNSNAKYTYTVDDSVVSVEHILGNNKVIEKIAFDKRESALPIVIDFEYNNLIPEIVNNQYIVFCDNNGDVRFKTSTIDVVDSSVDEILNYNISLTITKTGCTVVIVPTISSSSTVLNASLKNDKNEYSVNLALSTSTSSSNIVATYVHEGDSPGDHTDEQYMISGIYQSKLHRSYVNFLNMPSIPTNAQIFNATLVLKLRSTSTGVGGYSAWRVAQTWDEDTISFSNQPSVAYSPLDSNVPYDTINKKSYFKVTSAIRNYYTNGNAFNGFMISFTDETYNDYNAFCTDDFSTVSSRPSLVINYNPQSESEDNNTIDTADSIGIVSEPGNDSYIRGCILPEADCDYYEISPPRHGRIHVSLGYPYHYDSSGNIVYTPYNIEILDQNGSPVDYTVFNNSTGGKTLTFVALNGDPNTGAELKYYIKIYSTGAVSASSYRLTVFYPYNYYNLDWLYPLDPSTRYISSPIYYRTIDGESDYHTGIDIPGTTSNKVYSTCKGKVISRVESSTGGGKYLVISTDLGNGQGQKDEYTNNYFIIRYLHLNSIESNIVEGSIVEKGQLLGYMGSTGYSTGVHLHIDVNTGGHTNSAGIRSDYESLINPVDLYSDDIRFTDFVYDK